MDNDALQKIFTAAGDAINRKWEQAGFAWEAFPQIAAEALRDDEPLVQVPADDVCRWILTSQKIPKQHDLQAKFAQPPITAYFNEKFHIAFLCWTTSTTAIHQHGFEGAFRVFLGSSIQATYGFAEERRWGKHLLQGRIDTQSIELLQTGAICAIEHGASYIHSIYHLDFPSITLIVRTNGRPEQPFPQYNYDRPNFAVDPFHSPESLTRAKQVIKYLHQINHPQLAVYIEEALLATDAFGAYKLVQFIQGVYPEAGMPRLVERLGEKFGREFSDAIPALLRENDRDSRLVEARKTVTDPEGRFFCALLLNVTDKAHFRALLAERFPESDPQKVTAHWVTKLLELKGLGITASSFSGMLVRGMLSGLSAQEVVKKLSPILRTEAAVSTVRQHAAELVHLFRPIFDAEPPPAPAAKEPEPALAAA